MTFSFPGKATMVIAIKGHNNDGPGGIIGSFSDGLVTDGTWKCERNVSDDWNMEKFDDSTWSYAVAEETSDGKLWNSFPSGISTNAKRIWSGSYEDEYVDVYCRKKIGMYKKFFSKVN